MKEKAMMVEKKNKEGMKEEEKKENKEEKVGKFFEI
jgi:hypothetical protein